MNELQEAYEETVRAVVASVRDVRDGQWGERQWRRIVVNHETLAHEDEPETSTISFCVATLPGGRPEIVDFRLSRAAKNGLARIGAIMRESEGAFWTVCDLRIEAGGLYDFRFSYDPPYRLGGHLRDTRFDDYLARYLAGDP